jgi:hypothetical protein
LKLGGLGEASGAGIFIACDCRSPPKLVIRESTTG